MSQTQFWLDGVALPMSFFGWLNHTEIQQAFFEKLQHKQCRIILLEDLCYCETSLYLGYFSVNRFRCSSEMYSKILTLFEKSDYEISSWVYVRNTWPDIVERSAQYWVKLLIVFSIVAVIGIYGVVTWTSVQLRKEVAILQSTVQLQKEKNKTDLQHRPLAWKKSNQSLFYEVSEWSHTPSQVSRLWVSHQAIEMSGYCEPLTCESVQKFVNSKAADEKRAAIFKLGDATSLGTLWTFQDHP